MSGRTHTEKKEATGAEDDLHLFRQFLAGDDAAFQTFFRCHNPLLYTYCLKMLGSEQAAEDMAQEAWLRVIDLRSTDPQEIRNPVGFLIRIARNLSLDYRKSRRRIEPLGEQYEKLHPAYAMHEKSADEEIVLHCMERLPFEYRETLVLNIHCGYSFEEIARMLDKSPDAIWARASRGRKKLRELVMAAMEREEGALKVITKQRKEGR